MHIFVQKRKTVMRKKCLYCVNFTEYYYKQNNRFAYTGYGNCRIKKERVARHSCCADYKLKSPAPLNFGALCEELANTVTVLNGIRLIFDESGKQTEITKD